MPEINAATGALTMPVWAVGAVAAVFLVLLMLAIAQAGTATVMNALFRTAIVVAVLSAGWIYIQHTEQQEHAAARRALDERAAALLARAVAPGSALSCLNELAGEAVQTACEKAVFGSPESVSAAVNYVTAEIALLVDGLVYAGRVDPAYGAELAPMRAALQLDRFGIVAHVLAGRGCTADKCDFANLFSDPGRLLANLQDHAFDDRVTKFAAVWSGPPRGSIAEAAAALPGRPAATVSPQYDFPSSNSIPPVSIMAPEPGQQGGTAASGQASRQGTTPVPPKRPQPARAAARPVPRPPAAPAAPVAVGEAPTDGAAAPPPQ
jgi:hypothetical protein